MNLKLYSAAAVATALLVSCNTETTKGHRDTCITTETLLDEMVSRDVITRFPTTFYTQEQTSSHDRRSISPDSAGWFANDDGAGYERLDTIGGRIEKVMFDRKGPGVITRIWLTTKEKFGTMRFYLDGSDKPQIVIPAYDMRRFPADIPEALSLTHTHYTEAMDGVGGNTFFLPIPYSRSCMITFEEPDITAKIPRYYHINYRTYPEGTEVRTFSLEEARALHDKMGRTGEQLLHPSDFTDGREFKAAESVRPGGNVSIHADTAGAIRHLAIDVSGFEHGEIADVMQSLTLHCIFDGIECVEVPLDGFSGSGTGAPKVDCWYMSSDGNGKIKSRWVMPYRNDAVITVTNNWTRPVDISIEAITGDYAWDDSSMYFHCSSKSQDGIPLNNDYESDDNLDWNFTTIQGRGIYCGDMLTLYNHAIDWYGEGDEKIWVDDDVFPSHFGTGTEDYFNCSWAPVVVFLTPYGGAPRADEESSHGYNTFLRTRNLDIIPFRHRFRFDIEMLSWHKGTADYETVSFWHGDKNTKTDY